LARAGSWPIQTVFVPALLSPNKHSHEQDKGGAASPPFASLSDFVPCFLPRAQKRHTRRRGYLYQSCLGLGFNRLRLPAIIPPSRLLSRVLSL
ncbi:hypothetical protein FS749_006305, partial [Ceratobasidium sp. UAMH 11750]